MDRWRDISHTIPYPSGSPFRYGFQSPIDEIGFVIRTGAREWCEDQFGPQPTRWGTASFDTIFIRDPTDATAFKIRWC